MQDSETPSGRKTEDRASKLVQDTTKLLHDNAKIIELKEIQPTHSKRHSVVPANMTNLVNPLKNKTMKKNRKWKIGASTMANN